MSHSIYIVNSTGAKEPFSLSKVYRSARRVGASKNLAREIVEKVSAEIYPGITTAEIFKRIKKQLSQSSAKAALVFNLKEGMRKLGPTGFPFEKYIGEILQRNGFKVQINQHIPGVCCKYEIDFLAKKENLLYVGECKYHNLAEGRVHLDEALANSARFLDIKAGRFLNKIFKATAIKSLLVTNTKFTGEAIKYSECVRVGLLGWNYPKGEGLERLIDKEKLYPITILPSLKMNLAEAFVSRQLMLAEDVLDLDVEKFSRQANLPREPLKALVNEAETLLR